MNPQNREKISEAYAQAVERVGLDIDSTPLYLEYVRFLRECEAIGSYAEQQRGLAIRKVFQQAVVVPLAGIEHVWKEYCNFESEFQPVLADKIIGERNREFNMVKKIIKFLEPIVRALRREKLPSPPRTLEEERHQVFVFMRSKSLLNLFGVAFLTMTEVLLRFIVCCLFKPFDKIKEVKKFRQKLVMIIDWTRRKSN